MFKSILLLLAAVSTVSAHFQLNYPVSRGDSYNTQFQFPCGGMPRDPNKRHPWPTNGGAISVTPLHAFAFTSVNIGLGNELAETTDLNAFQKVMKPMFNQTGGNGTFCLPKVKIPASILPFVKAGVNATIQVVQLVGSGSALYNCADITFSDEEANRFAKPEVWNKVCFNSTGMSATYLGDPNQAINYTELAIAMNAQGAASQSIDNSRLALYVGLTLSFISTAWSLW